MSQFRRRPASVTTALALAASYAVALSAYAVALALIAEQSLELTTAERRAPVALATVTVLLTAAALVALGALATWRRKTDMLLVFALWLVALGAIGVAVSAVVADAPGLAAISVAAAAAAAAPIVLLLRRSARAWLPPIPLHDAVLVIVFGPVIGFALIAARHREDARLGLA
ncbi:hypothetical protein [Antiquaquibacter soli]|uniref:Uncharacterized protein n=1 Tax=Antiquaquibacter soli TaxID=3064523 RepID=A0ABT9BNC5_9MICO|nr:hypothetical protein [Protaetiibacter sp. WY-16]MDO7882538.1 hypothetical protein [Protaetiibacter sp. WY-16]